MATMDLQNIRDRLAGTLKVTGLSQIEFSRRYGVSYSTLNKFLKRRLRNPCVSTLVSFERAIAKASKPN